MQLTYLSLQPSGTPANDPILTVAKMAFQQEGVQMYLGISAVAQLHFLFVLFNYTVVIQQKKTTNKFFWHHDQGWENCNICILRHWLSILTGGLQGATCRPSPDSTLWFVPLLDCRVAFIVVGQKSYSLHSQECSSCIMTLCTFELLIYTNGFIPAILWTNLFSATVTSTTWSF